MANEMPEPVMLANAMRTRARGALDSVRAALPLDGYARRALAEAGANTVQAVLAWSQVPWFQIAIFVDGEPLRSAYLNLRARDDGFELHIARRPHDDGQDGEDDADSA